MRTTRVKTLVACLAVLAIATVVSADTFDLQANFQDSRVNRLWRAGTQIPQGEHAVEIGHYIAFNDNSYVVDDPTCDSLSDLGLMLDGFDKSIEVWMQHEHNGDTGELEPIQTFSFKFGAWRTDIKGLSLSAQSSETRTLLEILQFGEDGHLWINGEPTQIEYGSLAENDCPWVDNAFNVAWTLFLEDGVSLIEVTSRGLGAQKWTFGPYALPDEFAAEGSDVCRVVVPAFTGSYFVDGVICQSSAPLPEAPELPGNNRVLSR